MLGEVFFLSVLLGESEYFTHSTCDHRKTVSAANSVLLKETITHHMTVQLMCMQYTQYTLSCKVKDPVQSLLHRHSSTWSVKETKISKLQ